MMRTDLARALDHCLERVRNGEESVACVAAYPHLRPQLEPLLLTALCLSLAPDVAASDLFRTMSTVALKKRLREQALSGEVAKQVPAAGERNGSAIAWQRLVGVTARSRMLAVPIALAVLIAVGPSLLLFLPSVPGFQSAPSALASASTLTIVGDRVDVQMAGSNTWEEASGGMVLEAGTRVRTSPQSEALLTFFEGSTIRLEPNTDVVIQQIEHADAQPTKIVLKQWLGRTWSRVVKIADPGTHYEIQTPSAIALVRGTFFMTEVDEAASTTVQVVEGSVVVGAQEEEMVGERAEICVSAGYQVRVEFGAAPSQPLPIPDAERELFGGNGRSNDTGVEPSEAAVPQVDEGAVSDSDGSKVGDKDDVSAKDDDGSVDGSHESAPSASPGPTAPPTLTPAPTPEPIPAPEATPAPTPDPEPTPTLFTLRLNTTAGGSVTEPGEGVFSYSAGMVVDLLAVADPDHDFGQWVGNVVGIADTNAANTTITMNGDHNITANFKAKTYTLTTSSAAGGSVAEPGEGTFTYSAGTVVDLLAVADVGYNFVNWTGDVSKLADVNAADTTITINGDYTITANFDD